MFSLSKRMFYSAAPFERVERMQRQQTMGIQSLRGGDDTLGRIWSIALLRISLLRIVSLRRKATIGIWRWLRRIIAWGRLWRWILWFTVAHLQNQLPNRQSISYLVKSHDFNTNLVFVPEPKKTEENKTMTGYAEGQVREEGGGHVESGFLKISKVTKFAKCGEYFLVSPLNRLSHRVV